MTVVTSISSLAERFRVEFELGSADTDDVLAVRSLLDAALLDVEGIESRIESGDVLTASADGRIVGVIVLDPAADATHIAGIAVQRRRRGNGIGVPSSGRLPTAVDSPPSSTNGSCRSTNRSGSPSIRPGGRPLPGRPRHGVTVRATVNRPSILASLSVPATARPSER
ncbi:GNAT family N-acetyltransferase [Natronoarchaeum sp. GCM10025703]|uniref:GNAT family N-acetyltransferase n=1 Tax=Natronoarchaeum sp. GCM10025703 TaxID=3252685 RepID=UPI00361DAB82